jgi:multidrug efflux pump
MNVSAPFIARPVATTLLTIGVTLAGILAFFKLPVAPLPQVEFPTISVQAVLPGASPDSVATTVASPLERHLGQIAGVMEMTSSSILSEARVGVQFDLTRDLDGAARDVQAAINAARIDLPTNLRSNPIYRKVNPSDFPILILALTSKTLMQGQLFDAASTVLQQRLSQVEGVGQAIVGGSALPGVRVEINPEALSKYGIGLEDVRAALASANANSPKGAIEEGARHFQIYTNDQASRAADYRPLVIAYRNGSPVGLTDVATVEDSVEDVRNEGIANGNQAVMVIVFRQPGANIIDTVDRVKAELPHLEASMPTDVEISIASDRSITIRASLRDTELTLLLAVALVTVVVFLFLGDFRSTLIPSIAVPISIIGTFAAMYLLGHSLDNLSLMALTISTGFVVDDAIVVVENITRYMEAGYSRVQAALRGAAEVGFTVLSISISLIAVFIPILLMGAILGRMFREFAITLSMAILVSLVISLTTTPMMCSLLLRPRRRDIGASQRVFAWLLRGYEQSLAWALRRGRLVMWVLFATVCLNVVLYIEVPKGFFPQQDTGSLVGILQADQSISFQLMRRKLVDMTAIVQRDPAVQSVVGFTGLGGGGIGGQTNSGTVFIGLKPLAQRSVTADQVIARLREQLAQVAGATLYLQAVQDLRIGGRLTNSQYQYTLQSDTSVDLYAWTAKLLAVLQHSSVLVDVNSDAQQSGRETNIVVDRATAARFGLTMSQIDNTLYDAFGQRQVSTIYSDINQYHVVMEVAPRYWQSPETLKNIYISPSGSSASGTASTNAPSGAAATSSSTSSRTSRSGASTTTTSNVNNSARNSNTNSIAATGKVTASAGAAVSTSVATMIPLAAVAHYGDGTTPLAVNHHGLFVSSTLSFNLQPGTSLSEASAEIARAVTDIKMPSTIRGSLQGTARAFQASIATEPFLVLAAIVVIYIVLGILYESYIHPITILSTLPSAGVGAVLALMLFGTEFSVIALIGVILLIGIVKKNAILMIDFAIDAKRSRGLSAHDAIFEACLLRFRPIMMTTMAAMFGALPLALSFGSGSEMRQPLGIAIVGGLMVSQLLTLYTTPVVYLYLDRYSDSRSKRRAGAVPEPAPRGL